MKLDKTSFSARNIKKGINYIRNNGFDGVMSQIRYKMSGPGLSYNGWYKNNHRGDDEELARQREAVFQYAPVISILVSVCRTPAAFLRPMIESVQRQTYGKWELVIVDGSRADREQNADREQSPDKEQKPEENAADEELRVLETENIIREYMESDSRIRYILLERDQGVAYSFNCALETAAGEYIALLDHDDILTEDALYSVVSALQEIRYNVLYSDSDKMSEDGSRYSDPAFKPDFNIDLLRAYNYMAHLCVVKRAHALAVGGFRWEYDAAAQYDFILRCCEDGVRAESLLPDITGIKHIPRILYHWRIHGSAEERERKRQRTKEAGKRALEAHLNKTGCYATAAHIGETGMYKVVYDTPGNPLLTVIMHGNDTPGMMERCLMPLYEKNRYSNFEIIIVDTCCDDGEMTAFYRRMETMRKNIRVVTEPGLVSLPEIRNRGAELANADYLLFMDCNAELMDSTAIGEMLGICMRNEVGIVGGMLYADNRTVWSSGIIVGLNDIATDVYRGIRKGDYGYLMHNRVNCDYSAVSASCMLVKKDLFDKLGGFSDKFKSGLSDIDFCLRMSEHGRYVVLAADAGWYYHKTGTGHREEIPTAEKDLFGIFWDRILREGDPFYNSNFSLRGEPFSL